jgi:hypothetical protein
VAAGQHSLLRGVSRKVHVETPSVRILKEEVESLDLVREVLLEHILELLSDMVVVRLDLG